MDADGICVPKGACAGAGTVVLDGASDCFFDDVPAECCKPPAAKPNATTCVDRGGLCAPIGGCLQAGGYITPSTSDCKMGASYVCCVPFDYCGPQTIDCCTDSATFMPACDNGELTCVAGEPKPVDSCMTP